MTDSGIPGEVVSCPTVGSSPDYSHTGIDLCELCSEIDFEYLRAPTVRQLQQLTDGYDIGDRYPFKLQDIGERPRWLLGSMQRISESAAGCSMCRAVVQAASQINKCNDLKITPGSHCTAILQTGIIYFKPKNSSTISGDVARRMQAVNIEDMDFQMPALDLYWFASYEPNPLRNSSQPSTHCIFAYISPFDPYSTTQSAGTTAFEARGEEELVHCSRTVPRLISFDLLRTWLQKCTASHGDLCDVGTRSSVVPVFRLIDVKTSSIVKFVQVDLSELHYFALSYVWGQAQKLTIDQSNKVSLESPGSLTGKVSRTIQDAMDMTRMLECQYLWVDALCILQDDGPEKMIHISIMDEIYRRATVTIIAACGVDAEAGLAGVHQPRDLQQTAFQVKNRTKDTQDLHVVTSHTYEYKARRRDESTLDRTVWATRGWTLQERVVSRRTLVVTPTEVFWNCRSSNWFEGTRSECDLTHTRMLSTTNFLTTVDRWRAKDYQDGTDITFEQYARLVTNFSQRQLTGTGDGYDAFSAIVQELKRLTGVTSIWAIPTTRFELGLCWRRTSTGAGNQGQTRRTGRTTLAVTSLNCEVHFPSWSWLGWLYPVHMQTTDSEAEQGFSSEILCFIFRNSPPRVVRVSRVINDNEELKLPPIALKAVQGANSVTLETIAENCPLLRDLSKVPDDQLLFFWTDVAEFVVSEPAYIGIAKYDHYHLIRSHDGREVGRTEKCGIGFEEIHLCSTKRGAFEFVLLATNTFVEAPTEKTVIQVEWKDGIAFRVAIGYIFEHEWVKATTRRQLIAMG